jgi:hypothetical protein
MIILIEFLVSVGVVAIAGSLIYTGYRAGKLSKQDEEK